MPSPLAFLMAAETIGLLLMIGFCIFDPKSR